MMNKTRRFCHLVWTNPVAFWAFPRSFVIDITGARAPTAARRRPRL
ncbi:hypothetical protein [Actinomadura nitritigenes]